MAGENWGAPPVGCHERAAERQLFALGEIFLYQLVLLCQYETQLEVGKGIRALLRAA